MFSSNFSLLARLRCSLKTILLKLRFAPVPLLKFQFKRNPVKQLISFFSPSSFLSSLFCLSPQNRKLIQIKFVLKEMDSLYLDELRSTISQLMLNLESLPVSSKGGDSKYGLQKLKRYNQRWVTFDGPADF